jgi:hypothetical protein
MSLNPNYGYGLGGYGVGRYGSQPNPPISYYIGLITSQYQQSPKMLAWLQANLQILDDISQCINSFIYMIDLDYASGAQLDILGSIIGQSRTVGFQPSNGVSPVLDDQTYKLLLKARIAQNQWDGTIDGLQAVWQSLFPDGRIIIQDGQNMSATLILTGTFSSIIQDLITNGYIVPRPEGVLYNYSFGTLPIFGFGSSQGFIAGFDQGHWS